MLQQRAGITAKPGRVAAVRSFGRRLGLAAAVGLCLSAAVAAAPEPRGLRGPGAVPSAAPASEMTSVAAAVPSFQAATATAAAPAAAPGSRATPGSAAGSAESVRAMLGRYCLTCHSDRGAAAGLVPVSLQGLDVADVGAHPAEWEQVALKLRAGMMPPAGRPRPDAATYDAVAGWLESELDQAAADDPNPGRTTAHRLNRVQYGNAIRDLLGIEIDPEALLPPDDEDEGFDNIADVLSVSPTLMERYLYAARQVSQLAIGDSTLRPRFDTYRVADREIQDGHTSDDLPFGTRGGIAVRHYFPLDGEYSIRVGLRRNFYNYIRGIGNTAHPLDVRVDGVRVATFVAGGGLSEDAERCIASFCGSSGMGGAEWEWYANHADDDFEVHVQVPAGLRTVGVAFVRNPALEEGVLQPAVDMSTFGYSTDEEMGGNPAVGNVVIGGPFDGMTPAEVESRRRIFLCAPGDGAGEEGCAREIITALARRAYRRPVTEADVEHLLGFFESGRRRGDFDAGIQTVLERVLVDPEFLFRVPRPPAEADAAVYRIDDLELASRLSFFLWNSIPDDALLTAAQRGALSDPEGLERQVRRMLADPRSERLPRNFFGLWLELHKIRNVAPDPTIFPAFDENLRDAMQRETELFLASQLREDRSAIDLLRADYTFLNERLARHYGMPDVYGNHFRRVRLPDDRRAGLIGKGSILTLTSYSTRTSVVNRGKWLLERVLGSPPPAPPANVPPLEESAGDGAAPTSQRERMEAHRANPSCAVCHRLTDPLGFSLDNFDAIGRWRTTDDPRIPGQRGPVIDASGVTPDGHRFEGPAGLRELLLDRRQQFVRTVAERLLTYSLGRRLEHYDRPVVRRIVRDAGESDYRWSALIQGIVESEPFQLRRVGS